MSLMADIFYHKMADGQVKPLPPCPLNDFKQCRVDCAWYNRVSKKCAIIMAGVRV